MNKNHLYAFYGSLRAGMYNNNRFSASGMQQLGSTIISGFRLYSLGSYPCVVRTGDDADKVTVDLFSVTGETESRIHHMEIGAGYEYEEIRIESPIEEINGKEFGIYTFDTSALGRLKDRYVPGGDWVKHLQPTNESR